MSAQFVIREPGAWVLELLLSSFSFRLPFRSWLGRPKGFVQRSKLHSDSISKSDHFWHS